MTRVWWAFDMNASEGPVSLRRFFLGQCLALLAALATFAAYLLFGPLFGHSV
jgi:hypothetical protein